MPAEGAGRTALRRLLDRIRTQRDQWGRREPAEGEGRAVRVENASNEHGSPRNLEWQQASSLEEGTVDTSLAENSKKKMSSIFGLVGQTLNLLRTLPFFAFFRFQGERRLRCVWTRAAARQADRRNGHESEGE